MEIFVVCIGVYLLIGLGFTLSAWLQAAELEVNKCKDIPAFLTKSTLVFILFWSVIALYCYRAEIKKSIEKVDFSKYHDSEG